MRIPLTASIALAASLCIATPAEAAKPCTFRGARTIVQNTKVRVYKQLSKDHFLMKYYGCVKRTGRTFKLDAIEAETGAASSFRLIGYIVGYRMYYSDETGDSSQGYVASWNVKKRALINRADATTNTNVFYAVDEVLMTRTGALTWIGSYEAGPDKGIEVHVMDQDGNRVVDSGTDIEKGTLALTGEVVSWTRAGVTKTATIGS
jgi:hypothetical protein